MNQKKILIIDDDEDILILLSDYLIKAGYLTVTAKSAKEALKKVKDEKIHLIILDRLLPDLSGEEVVEKLKKDKKTTNIPVILISSNQPRDVVNKVDLFILKPCKLKDLNQAVDVLLSDIDS